MCSKKNYSSTLAAESLRVLYQFDKLMNHSVYNKYQKMSHIFFLLYFLHAFFDFCCTWEMYTVLICQLMGYRFPTRSKLVRRGMCNVSYKCMD